MKITKRQQVEIKAPGFIEKAIYEEDIISIDLLKVWEDSLVQRVYFPQDVIGDINAWVQLSLEQGVVPEVGGLLFGQGVYHPEAGGRYEILIEKFFPLKAVEKSTQRFIEVGTEALRLFDEEREKYGPMRLLGWFHTHPGHTPFLSDTDLHTHEGFFTQPYQIAIVLDSLTPNWDTGIFSRKFGKHVNNKIDKIQWIQWKKLM